MPPRYHNYADQVAGSDYAPLPLILKDAATGLALDLTGASVTITIVDETSREVIVEDGEAEANSVNPYLIEYFLTEEQADKITRPSVWIAQWKLTAGSGKVHKVPTICRMQVFPAIL